jgi:hypothetical protein
MPVLPDLALVLNQDAPLHGQLGAREAAAVDKVPTAVAFPLADVHVRRMRVVVREDEDAVTLKVFD